jgi:hypothetical protein
MKTAHEMNELSNCSDVKFKMTILKSMLEHAETNIEKAARAGQFQTMFSGQQKEICNLLKKELEAFGYSCSEPECFIGVDQNEYRMVISWLRPGNQSIE